MCRRCSVFLLMLPVLTVHALVANASHDVPRKAAAIRVGLVRAHDACTVPNAVHDQVVVFASACAPAVPLSAYAFGTRGQGKAQIQTVADGIALRFALTDVRTAGDSPADGITFVGRVLMRLTDDGCSSEASCTVELFIQIDVPCVNGRCYHSQTYPDAFLPVGLNGSAEVLRVDVLDDAGNRFATNGLVLN